MRGMKGPSELPPARRVPVRPRCRCLRSRGRSCPRRPRRQLRHDARLPPSSAQDAGRRTLHGGEPDARTKPPDPRVLTSKGAEARRSTRWRKRRKRRKRKPRKTAESGERPRGAAASAWESASLVLAAVAGPGLPQPDHKNECRHTRTQGENPSGPTTPNRVQLPRLCFVSTTRPSGTPHPLHSTRACARDCHPVRCSALCACLLAWPLWLCACPCGCQLLVQGGTGLTRGRRDR